MFRTCLPAVVCLLGGMTVQASTPVPAAGDAARGKAVYAQCLGCHSPDRHRTGPKHCGLIGRKSGTASGYEYSKAMQQANVVWSAQTLDHFLFAPLSFIPGTKMGVAGIKNAKSRRDLIAYLIVINEQPGCD